MELNITRKPIFINEELINETVEQPIECDALIPDYCPDIMRILKCSISPVILSGRVNNKAIMIDGFAVVSVYYVSDHEIPAKTEFKVPFSRSVELKCDCSDPILELSASENYVNCRAVNQRRIDLRGAVSIKTKGYSCREEQVIYSADGLGIQLKSDELSWMRPCGQYMRDMHITENIDIAYGQPPISSIVRCSAQPQVTECRLSPGRAAVKGEITLKLLYYSDTGTWERLECTIPTNTVIDADRALEDSRCDVHEEVVSVNCEYVADEEGHYRGVKADIVTIAHLRVHNPVDAKVSSDCYSTRHPSSFKTKAINTMSLLNITDDEMTHKEILNLPQGTESIIDLWCDVISSSARTDADSLIVDARMCISGFVKNSNGELMYIDKLASPDIKLPNYTKNCFTEPRITCKNCSYNFVSDSSVEVRCDISVSGPVYAVDQNFAIDEISIDDKKEKSETVPRGLYICLGGGNESLWDIAKRYNTSIDRIMEENNEEENSGILIIPVVG